MDGADVRFIPVLREWLASLTAYRGDADEAMSAARMEARRGEEWLHTQLGIWQKAVRDREEDVHQAKMELSAKKVPGPTGRMPDTTLEEKALRRARVRLEHAEEKVRVCRAWLSRLPKLIDEMFAAPAHRLQTFLDTEFSHAQSVLLRQAEALERYAELKADFSSAPKSPPYVAAPPKENPK